MSERPAPSCRESGYCTGPNAYAGVCDCHDAIWHGEKWWEHKPVGTITDMIRRAGDPDLAARMEAIERGEGGA